MEIYLTEQTQSKDDVIGRGNTDVGHNPFSFYYDRSTKKASIAFDGYDEVTAKRADVRRAIEEMFSDLDPQ